MSKNILIVGGGAPNRFGNIFVLKAREEGHRVINLTHQDRNTGNPDDVVMNFWDENNINDTIKGLNDKLSHIDIIIFNQNSSAYPATVEDLNSQPNMSFYMEILRTSIIIPHMILATLKPKMSEGSKVFFMTSGMGWEYDKFYDMPAVGYAGVKSWQAHMSTKLGNFRDKKITYICINPFFVYTEADFYETKFMPTYNFILETKDEFNAKIVELNFTTKQYQEVKIRKESK